MEIQNWPRGNEQEREKNEEEEESEYLHKKANETDGRENEWGTGNTSISEDEGEGLERGETRNNGGKISKRAPILERKHRVFGRRRTMGQ